MKIPLYRLSHLLKYAFFVIFVLLSSCKTGPSSVKPAGLGAPGELLVAIDPAFENTDIKKGIEDFARRDFPSLPQAEPTFKVTSISLSELEKHFKSYRNIIIVKQSVDAKFGVDFKQNVWAKNQQVIEFYVVNSDSFNLLFSKKKNELYDFLYYGDIHTMAEELRKDENVSISKFLKNKYNVDMVIPKGYRLVRDTSDFSWFRYDYKEVIQNVLIKSFPLDSVVGTSKENLMNLCNLATQQYVPGPILSTYMTIEDKFPVAYNELASKDGKVMELRGVWKVQGYFMGGPFVNYFVKDVENNRLVMIEAFVFAPRKQNKAYYMRQMESVLYTLRLS